MIATSEANKDVIRKLLADVDRGDADVVERYYAPEYVDHTPSPIRRQAPGREGVRQAIELFRRAFPDSTHQTCPEGPCPYHLRPIPAICSATLQLAES